HFVLFSIAHSRHHRSPHSFPTRRSSDLPIGRMSISTSKSAKRWVGEQSLAPETIRGVRSPHADIHLVVQVDGARREGSQGFTRPDRKSTRLNSSHQIISYAVFCLKKKKT